MRSLAGGWCLLKADIERFLDRLRVERQSSKNTLTAYRTDLRQFERVLTAQAGRILKAEELTPPMVAGYVGWLQSRGYRAATVARKMVAVRLFLTTSAPGSSAELSAMLQPPPTPRRQPQVLTPAEFAKLRQAPAELASPRGLRDTALLDLMYVTGLRASEVTDLDLDHLELANARVRSPRSSGRLLPLGAACSSIQDYLDNGRVHLVQQPAERALFVNLRGKRLSRQGLWLVVKRWSESAGLDARISPHSLRHSMAHAWLSQGKSRRELQRALGLSSPSAIRVRPKSSTREG